jgi:hypothetical protein
MPDQTSPPADPNYTPFDHDSRSRPKPPSFEPVSPDKFLYIGKALTAEEFIAYVRDYDFGPIPPDFVVLHHSGIPSTRHARYQDPKFDVWDGGEEGLSDEAITARRLRKLNNIKEYYRTAPALEWDRGPHLYIDDRYIYLFSPMAEEGIHARWGNGFTDGRGNFHYSIGIEVFGYYEQVRWPEPVARLVGVAVAALKDRLKTFELTYLYPNGSPGVVGSGEGERCPHPERLTWGGISSHRDYNKPSCPGKAVSEAFYLEALTAGWEEYRRLTGTGAAVDDATILERAYQADRARLGAKRFAGLLKLPELGDAAAQYLTLVCERGMLAVVQGQARDVTARCIEEFLAVNEQAGAVQRF